MEGQKWHFSPTPKVSAQCHRAVSTEKTLSRLRVIARRVPISRVADITPLDRLGLPVFSATTPLARDLTTHGGKGLTPDLARISAMMEAIERVSAEEPPGATVRASYREFDKSVPDAIDPRSFELSASSRYHPDLPLSWIEAWDLGCGAPAWVPLDLVINPGRDGILHGVDTNGLAAGNTLLEAVVHGLCEVIERDALSVASFRSSFVADPSQLGSESRVIEPETLPEDARAWTRRIRDRGLHVVTEVLTSDLAVPTFRSVITDDDYPSAHGCTTRRFVGLGASPSAAIGATRSITEAVQSRLAIIQGARDSFNTLSNHRPDDAAAPRRVGAKACVPLETVRTFESDDLLEDLHHILASLRAVGLHRVLVIDLSREAFGFPVVRVRVPGIAGFAVDPTRVGWRCLRALL